MTFTHWFVSDTHFCASRPDHIEAFKRLSQLPQAGDSLVLLGDIFEIWIGDDLATESDKHIEALLLACTDRGVHVYFMPGNRDFMVGKDFLKRTGCHYLKDPSIWCLPTGARCILSHGDWFCTDDIAYKRYRRLVRNPVFQFLFNLLPQKKRRAVANNIRKKSIANHRLNGNQSYDANAELIQQSYKRFAPISTLIMGHTHLPNVHQENDNTRIVLGDWRDTLWFAKANLHGIELFEADLQLGEIHARFTI